MTHFLKQVLIEVKVGKSSLIWSTKRSFACKWVYDLKFFPHYHSHCWFFCLFDGEGAIAKVEEFWILVKESREDVFFRERKIFLDRYGVGFYETPSLDCFFLVNDSFWILIDKASSNGRLWLKFLIGVDETNFLGLRFLIAVTEDILIPWVAMQVKNQEHFPFLFHLLYHLLVMKSSGVKLWRGIHPVAIEIHAWKIAPSVPINDPVWIQHGHQFE